MIEHYLKIENVHLDDLLARTKCVEIRFDDRNYQVGDLLVFRNAHAFEIIHIHSGLGLEKGYVALSVTGHPFYFGGSSDVSK